MGFRRYAAASTALTFSKLTGPGIVSLLSLCYASTDTACPLSYTPHGHATIPISLNNGDVLERFSRHKLPGDGSFKPHKMEVRGKAGSRGKEDLRRLFLLGKDRIHYKIVKFAARDPSKGDLDQDVSMS